MIMVWLNVCYTCEDSYKFHPFGIGLVFQIDKDGTTAIGRVLNKHGGVATWMILWIHYETIE